ncbi:hypothetical protein [Sphingobium lactosutens]|uniref:hypothetical protein n=1 Tax=Sphingobium lactosutens TaxID=522773 RepID=UPI001D1890D8|nr:hypothetical protein [Sphingobium lactosutens]MCC4257005.1 hypothetical protein [Sphingobium lactosutens]
MALKNRVAIATYEYDGDEIQLQANFAALERLSESVGIDPIVYIQSMKSLRDITEVFFHLQFGTTHTRQEIYECFFADVVKIETDEETQQKIGVAIAIMLGAKQNEVLEALEKQKAEKEKAAKESAPKKK